MTVIQLSDTEKYGKKVERANKIKLVIRLNISGTGERTCVGNNGIIKEDIEVARNSLKYG